MLLFGEIWCPNWLIYVIILLVLVYIHYVYVYGFWKRQGVPGPTPWPLVGTINPNLLPTVVHETEQAEYLKYGPVYGKFEFSQKILSVNDPELLKLILIKDFDVFKNRRPVADEHLNNALFLQKDEVWKNARKFLSPMFSAGKLKKMSPLITSCCKDLQDALQEKANSKESFDARDVFKCFALNVIGRCIFGIDIDFKDPNSPFMKHARAIFDPSFSISLLFVIFLPKIAKALKLSGLDKRAIDFFLKVVTKVFEERKNKKSDRVDFVQQTLEIMEEEEIKDRTSGGISMSYEEINAQAITFILAGTETTSTTLAFMAYNCALYPETQEKLIEEVDGAIKKYGEVNYDAVQEMPYLSAFVNETLRLYPPATRGDRVCSQDYQLSSVFIPKGTIVNMSWYCLHKDPKYWPNPETFDPERFLGENAKRIHPYTFLPFLDGPRNCIAKRFALLDIKLCFASVMSKMRFKKSPETKIPLEFKPSLELLAAKSVDLTAEWRE